VVYLRLATPLNASVGRRFANLSNPALPWNSEEKMTRLREEAFARISELPADAQDELARWLLSELESERRWSKLFEKSGDVLDRLAEEALAEHRRGETKELDPNNL
jgi:hypothetical protein